MLITGVDEGDGTGTLAAAWPPSSHAARRVTLLDAGGGEVTVLSGLSAEPGSSDAIQNPADPVPVSPPAAASVRRRPRRSRGRLEAVRIADAKRIVDELTANDGVVVVHAAPPLVSAATLVWARVADVTVLGVRRLQARRSMISDAVEHLEATGANLGVRAARAGPGRSAAGRRRRARAQRRRPTRPADGSDHHRSRRTRKSTWRRAVARRSPAAGRDRA